MTAADVGGHHSADHQEVRRSARRAPLLAGLVGVAVAGPDPEGDTGDDGGDTGDEEGYPDDEHIFTLVLR